VRRSGPIRQGRSPEAIFRSTVFVCGDPQLGATPRHRRHLHAVDHSLVVDDLGDDPDRWLVIGPGRAANLLELVVLITTEGDELIIHAMPLRPIYRKLLEP
jgi:hypothetical protein